MAWRCLQPMISRLMVNLLQAQLPIVLAYAVSIYKAQGLTLDRAVLIMR